jgi:hypothetical protein
MKRLVFFSLFLFSSVIAGWGQGTVVVIADPTATPHTLTWRLPPGALASNIVVPDYTPVAQGFAVKGKNVASLYGTFPPTAPQITVSYDPVYGNAFLWSYGLAGSPTPLNINQTTAGVGLAGGYLISPGLVSNYPGGSWQEIQSVRGGIEMGGFHVAPTPDNLGGYVALAPVPYAPYGSNSGTAGTVCFDVYGNVVTQPTPLPGLSPTLWTSSATSTVVEWNGPSPMQGYYNPSNPTIAPTPYPINGTPCTPPIQTPSGIPYGINNSSYYFGIKGFATADYAYNAFQGLSDGTHTAGGLVIGQALATTIYPQGTITAQFGTLTTPTALGGLFYAYPSDQWPSPGTIATVHNPLLDGYTTAYQGMFAYNSTLGTNGALGVYNGTSWGPIGSWVQYGDTYSASKAVFVTTGYPVAGGSTGYIQSCSNLLTGDQTSIPCTFGASMVAGDLWVACFADDNEPSLTWTGAATPVLFTRTYAGGGIGYLDRSGHMGCFYATAVGGETSIVVSGATLLNPIIQIAEFRGFGAVDAVSSPVNTVTTTVGSAAVTPAASGELILGIAYCSKQDYTTSFASQSPFTQFGASGWMGSYPTTPMTSYFVQPSAGSIAAQFNLTAAAGSSCFAETAAFSISSGGGGSGVSSGNGNVQIGNPTSEGETTLIFNSGAETMGAAPTSYDGPSHIWGIGAAAFGQTTGDVFSIYNFWGNNRMLQIQAEAPTGTLTMLNNGSVTLGYDLTDDGTNSALEVKGILQSSGSLAGKTLAMNARGVSQFYLPSGAADSDILVQGESGNAFVIYHNGEGAFGDKVLTKKFFELIAGGSASPDSGYGGLAYTSGCTYDFYNATTSAWQSFNPCGGLVNSITVGGTAYSGALTLTGSTNEIVVVAGGSAIQLSLADGQQICKTCDPQFHDVYASDGYYIGTAGSSPTNVIDSTGQFVGSGVNTSGTIVGSRIQAGGSTGGCAPAAPTGIFTIQGNLAQIDCSGTISVQTLYVNNGSTTTISATGSSGLFVASVIQAGGATGGCSPAAPTGIFTIQGSLLQIDCSGTESLQTLYVNNGGTTTISATGATGLLVATTIQAGGATGGCAPVSPTSIFTIQGNKFGVDCDGNASLGSALYVNDTTGSPVTVISAVASTKTVTAGAFAFGTQGTWQYGLSVAGAATLATATWGGAVGSLNSDGSATLLTGSAPSSNPSWSTPSNCYNSCGTVMGYPDGFVVVNGKRVPYYNP